METTPTTPPAPPALAALDRLAKLLDEYLPPQGTQSREALVSYANYLILSIRDAIQTAAPPVEPPPGKPDN